MLVVTIYPLSRYGSSHGAHTALVCFLGRHKPPPNGPPCNRRVSIQQRPPDDHDQKGRRDGDHPIYPNLRGGVQLLVPVGEERGAEESLSGVSATCQEGRRNMAKTYRDERSGQKCHGQKRYRFHHPVVLLGEAVVCLFTLSSLPLQWGTE